MAAVTNSFGLILDNDVGFGRDRHVEAMARAARPHGSLMYRCPTGDVTGEELAACTLWEGVIYSADDKGAVGLLPAEGTEAPRSPSSRSRAVARNVDRPWGQRVFKSAVGRIYDEGLPGMSAPRKCCWSPAAVAASGPRPAGWRKAGYRIAINYASNQAAADALVAEIEAAGGDAFAVRGDVGVEADILAMFDGGGSRYGRLDALRQQCRHRRRQGACRRDERGAARTHDAHQRRRLHPLRPRGGQAHVDATRRKGGAIVNVSSAAAVLGAPDQYVDYAASKGAIDTFTVGLAREVATEGIRVNAVRPGIIDTDIHASGGQPDRVALLQDTLPMKRAGTAG